MSDEKKLSNFEEARENIINWLNAEPRSNEQIADKTIEAMGNVFDLTKEHYKE